MVGGFWTVTNGKKPQQSKIAENIVSAIVPQTIPALMTTVKITANNKILSTIKLFY